MTPIQQLMLGAGGSTKTLYLDDVFNTIARYTANGYGGNNIFNNGNWTYTTFNPKYNLSG